MREDISFKIQRTRIVPLRWLANYLFEPLSMIFFNMGLRRHDVLEDMGAEEKIFKNDLRLKLWWRLYEILGEPYMKWGTMYQIDIAKLKKELEDMDLSGSGWDDYDENGVPYWEKTGVVDPDYRVPTMSKEQLAEWRDSTSKDWDFEDFWTRDAFRVIKKD